MLTVLQCHGKIQISNTYIQSVSQNENANESSQIKYLAFHTIRKSTHVSYKSLEVLRHIRKLNVIFASFIHIPRLHDSVKII